jgi:diguanylate cyclase
MTTEDAAVETVQRLAEVLRREPVVHAGEQRQVTASFGVAVVDLERETVPAALARADRALYEAKRAGRDRVHRAEPLPPQG